MTTLTFAPYIPPSGSCTGKAGRGTLTFASYMEFLYKEQFSMGAYVCRQIAGKALLSGHAKGRAYDEGLPLAGTSAFPVANPLGLIIIDRVCQHGKELGIDHCIFNRGGTGRGRPTIWNMRNPAGEPYLGVHPHKDHIHWGLTTLASQNLTWATLDHYLGAEMTDAEWVKMEKLIASTVRTQVAAVLKTATPSIAKASGDAVWSEIYTSGEPPYTRSALNALGRTEDKVREL